MSINGELDFIWRNGTEDVKRGAADKVEDVLLFKVIIFFPAWCLEQAMKRSH